MDKYNIKNKKIELHNIVFAITSEPDYNMERLLLLEDMPDVNYDEYVLVEGSHCSCYDFDDCCWDAIKLNRTELIKLISENDWGVRKDLQKFIDDGGI